MGIIAKAIAWGGSDVTLSMFIISEPSTATALDISLKPAPTAVRQYALEDENRILGGQAVLEYDFVFQELPPNLTAVLELCFHAARRMGARVAWFGFEGSFDFEFLLTKETATQVYAILDSHGVSIASDEMLYSKEWEARIVEAGIEARAGAAEDSK